MKNNQSVAASICRTLTRVRQLGRRSVRDSQRRFWIEGIRHFVQAFDAKYAFDEVVYSPILLKSPLAEMLVRRLGAASVKRVRVSPEQFRSISKDARASGIGAIVRQQWTTLEQADATIGLCWLVIEDLRSPGNLGTIFRTAEAVGAAGVVFLGKACDPFDPVVLHSMGGVFHLSLSGPRRTSSNYGWRRIACSWSDYHQKQLALGPICQSHKQLCWRSAKNAVVFRRSYEVFVTRSCGCRWLDAPIRSMPASQRA